jgi:long-subunit acyl-CoA synthetase (AMP-forming)
MARRRPGARLRDSVADEMAYVLDHAEVVQAAVQDQEHVDKLLSIAERVPSLRHILYDEEGAFATTITPIFIPSPR